MVYVLFVLFVLCVPCPLGVEFSYFHLLLVLIFHISPFLLVSSVFHVFHVLLVLFFFSYVQCPIGVDLLYGPCLVGVYFSNFPCPLGFNSSLFPILLVLIVHMIML